MLVRRLPGLRQWCRDVAEGNQRAWRCPVSMREDSASSVVAQPADLVAVLLAAVEDEVEGRPELSATHLGLRCSRSRGAGWCRLRPGRSSPCGGRTPVWYRVLLSGPVGHGDVRVIRRATPCRPRASTPGATCPGGWGIGGQGCQRRTAGAPGCRSGRRLRRASRHWSLRCRAWCRSRSGWCR